MKRIDIIDGITTGGVFSKDIDDNFVELSGNTVTLNNSILIVSGKTNYNTQLNSNLTIPNDIGGIVAGTSVSSLRTKSLIQIFDDLLFPTILPTYEVPIITLNSSITGIVEIGTMVSTTLSVNGTKNDAGAFIDLKILMNGVEIPSSNVVSVVSVGDVDSQFGYINLNNPNYVYMKTDNNTTMMNETLTSAPSTITYQGYGSYSAGLAKMNSKGILDSRNAAIRSINAPQAASTNFATNQIMISGYYPFFYGASSTQVSPVDVITLIESNTNTVRVINSGSGALSMHFNANGDWCWFAIFEPYNTKTTWSENALNMGNIGGGSNLFASPIILPISDLIGSKWFDINYKVYVANKLTTLGTAIIS